MKEEPLYPFPKDLKCIKNYFLCNHDGHSYFLSLVVLRDTKLVYDTKFVIDRVEKDIDDCDYLYFPIIAADLMDDEEYEFHKEGYDKAAEIANNLIFLI